MRDKNIKKNLKMKICISLAVVALSCMSLAPLIVGVETEYGSAGEVSNVAPLIVESRFSQSDTMVYIGESVEFAVDVSDGNGAADISWVKLVLSDDESVSTDDISIPLDRTAANVDATTSTFGKTWTAEGEMGQKNILITAEDSDGLSASNNGVKVGTIELNPMMGFEVTDGTGSGLTTISFPASPPGTDVSSNQNTIQVKNTGGTALKVFIHGTDMISGTETIQISNMNVDGTSMTTTSQLIATIEPGASSSHNILLHYPIGIPAGTYQGTVILDITT
jgi:hypothetical protein